MAKLTRFLSAGLLAAALALAALGSAAADAGGGPGANHGCAAHNGNSQIGSCGNGNQPPPHK